ncbi:MAG: HEPN domain-containing protein, partial [Deltaproteobacteria bacterium]|nr:HEPN domain-containing protein [Deltaproteobacteria bacterium]
KHYSKILHQMFNMRQEGDYKELVEISRDDAVKSIEHAKTFLDAIEEFVNKDE